MDEIELNSLRKRYEPITDYLLFFAMRTDQEQKQRNINLFVETWDQIPESYRDTILYNLEFILCKRVQEYMYRNNSKTPACTYLNKSSRRCYIIFSPFFRGFKHKTNIHILAHELAHSYFNHPEIGSALRCIREEREFVDNTAEPQAYELVEYEWKICPDPEDFGELKKYIKYIHKA